MFMRSFFHCASTLCRACPCMDKVRRFVLTTPRSHNRGLLPIQLPSYGLGRTQRAWLKEISARHGNLLRLKCVMIILIIMT